MPPSSSAGRTATAARARRPGSIAADWFSTAYARAGRKLPRSTDDQRVAAQRIKLSELQPGDLVFFDQEGRKNSHVGIYIGNGEFVHAPSSGKRVRRDRLDMPYWSRHISEARRPNG